MQTKQTEPQPRSEPIPAQPPPPPDKPVETYLTTLKELGPNLPCGIVVGDKRVKVFRLRPFRLKEEKELGQLRESGKGMTFGQFTSGVLSKMVNTVGPYAFDTKNENERRLIISQMFMPDVLYMYLYLRYEALGPEEPVPMRAVCPNCRSDFKFNADLGSLEVNVVPEDAIDLRRTYDMRDGVEIQGKERKRLILQPIIWHTMEDQAFSKSNQGNREAQTILTSIVGAEGVTMNPLVLGENSLDLMTKYDLEGIKRDIEDNTPGPIMVINTDCVNCKYPFQQMINWAYESFFTRPSRPRTGRI